jgi:pentapeptide repeat protein
MRLTPTILTLVASVTTQILSPALARADIFRWDNGQVIPGTQGITPGPAVQLDHRQLEFSRLYDMDLNNSRFDYSNLTGSDLHESTLTNASFASANLTNTQLSGSTLTDADLSGAVVTGASFGGSDLSMEQLYSTTSCQQKRS